MTDILDETDEFINSREGKRPVFLTVLCILTWVGSGIAFFSGLMQVSAYAMMNETMNSLPLNGSNTFGYMFWGAMAGITGSILCSFGAFLMFKLKKTGFFIYLFGQIIPLIAAIYSTLIISSGMTLNNQISTFIIIGTMIFPIAFIIMYGVHLKYMNK